MLNAGNAELERLLESPTRNILTRVLVDWEKNSNFTGTYDDISDVLLDLRTDSDFTGSLPMEATLVEGFSAGRLEMSLGGSFANGQRVIDIFSPYRSDSPFYGISLMGATVSVEYGVQISDGSLIWTAQFTGLVTEVNVDHGSQTVTVSALDNADKLRASVSLPIYYTASFKNYERGIWVDRISDGKVNSQWLIDYVLRRNGIFQSPPPPAQAVMNFSGHGGWLCDYSLLQMGSYISSDPYSAIYPTSRYGKMLAVGSPNLAKGAPRVEGWNAQKLRVANGNGITIQFQAYFGPSNAATLPDYPLVYVMTDGGDFMRNILACGLNANGQPYIRLYTNGVIVSQANFTAPAALGWHDVALGVSMNGSNARYYGRLDNGALQTLAITTASLGALDTNRLSSWVSYAPVPVSNLVVCQASDVGLAPIQACWYNATYVPMSDIDPGLNYLSSFPLARGEDSWEMLKDIIGSELGTHGFLESGKYYFVNRENSVRNRLTVDKDITPNISLSDIKFAQRADSVRNVVSLTVADRYLPIDSTGTLFEAPAPEAFASPPGVSQFYIQFDQIAIPDTFFYSGDSFFEAFPDFSAFVALDYFSNAELAFGIVTLKLEPTVDPFIFKLIVTNNHVREIKFGRNAEPSAPALRIVGKTPVDGAQQNSLYFHETSISRHGERVLEIGGGRFHQLELSFETVVRGLLDELHNPVPVVESVVLTTDDFRLQLRDVVRMRHPDFGEEILAMITSQARDNDAGITGTYNVRLFGMPKRWILGHTTYSVLGSTTIAG